MLYYFLFIEILLKLDHEYYKNGTPDAVIQNILLAKQGVINRISENCGGQDLLEGTDEFKWTFTNSVFFAFTAVTTIGKHFTLFLYYGGKLLYRISLSQTFLP